MSGGSVTKEIAPLVALRRGAAGPNPNPAINGWCLGCSEWAVRGPRDRCMFCDTGLVSDRLPTDAGLVEFVTLLLAAPLPRGVSTPAPLPPLREGGILLSRRERLRARSAARRRALFEEAGEVIEREYASDLEIDLVARRIATSKRQLQRAFAEAGGTTFRAHVADVRMRKARELIEGEQSATIATVAQRVGYRHAPQFAKAFRQHHGCNPSEVQVA